MTAERKNPRLACLVLALAVAFVVAGCGRAEQDRAGQTSDSVAEQARQAGHEIGQQLDQLGQDVRRTVERAAEDVRSSSQGVREAAARNGVAAAAGGEFKRHGVELDGMPTCSATSPTQGQYHVECTGRTTDGKPISLVGDDPGEAPSTFVGSVDGKEVFRQSCVGLC